MKTIDDVPKIKGLDYSSELEQPIADVKALLAKMDEPHEPYTQRFDGERARRTLDKLIGRKGEKK